MDLSRPSTRLCHRYGVSISYPEKREDHCVHGTEVQTLALVLLAEQKDSEDDWKKCEPLEVIYDCCRGETVPSEPIPRAS